MTNTAKTFAILACATALFASPAKAQDRNSAEVVFADLDLTSEAGVERFDARLRVAVNRVCSTTSTPDRHEMRWIRICRSQTAAQINDARNEAIRIARSGEARGDDLAMLIAPVTSYVR